MRLRAAGKSDADGSAPGDPAVSVYRARFVKRDPVRRVDKQVEVKHLPIGVQKGVPPTRLRYFRVTDDIATGVQSERGAICATEGSEVAKDSRVVEKRVSARTTGPAAAGRTYTFQIRIAGDLADVIDRSGLALLSAQRAEIQR